GHGVTRSRAKAPERAGVDPQAGLFTLDQPPGERDEIPPVADDDRVRVRVTLDLGDEPGWMHGRRIGLRHRLVALAAGDLVFAQRRDPGFALRRAGHGLGELLHGRLEVAVDRNLGRAM